MATAARWVCCARECAAWLWPLSLKLARPRLPFPPRPTEQEISGAKQCQVTHVVQWHCAQINQPPVVVKGSKTTRIAYACREKRCTFSLVVTKPGDGRHGWRVRSSSPHHTNGCTAVAKPPVRVAKDLLHDLAARGLNSLVPAPCHRGRGGGVWEGW